MSNIRDPFSRAETQAETPGPLGHQDFASPDRQGNRPSISSMGPQGVEPDRGKAALEEGRKNVIQTLQDLQKFRSELAVEMVAGIKETILDSYGIREDESVSPEVRKQIEDKVSSTLAHILKPQNSSVGDYARLEGIGFSWKLVQRHKKLLSDFLDAVEKYLKARKESKQSGGFLPKSSKDTLSEYWDWSEELLKEYAITGAMIGDESFAHNVVWKTTITLVEEASWDAFEIYEKAYKEWVHDKQSSVKKEKFAESGALLTANLYELSQLDSYSDTITEIGKRMEDLSSP